MWSGFLRKIPTVGFCLVEIQGIGPYLGARNTEGPPAYFVVASGGGLLEGYGHDGLGAGLGNEQTEDGLPSRDGRSDALLRRVPRQLI